MSTTRRAVRSDDAEALLAIWHAHQIAVLGRPDTTLDEARDVVEDPDLHSRSLLAHDAAGRPLGCALVFAAGDSGRVDVDVVVDPVRASDLFGDLLAHAVSLAADRARACGSREVRIDQSCYRDDVRTADALRAAGFQVATTFHRMRRSLDGPVDVRLPDGVTVERVDDETDDVLRRAYDLHATTFAGHFGVDHRPFEQWLAAVRARTGTGPLWFARLHGDDVGFLHETDQFVEDEDAGYVWRLGVADRARGRGVAKALLLSAFVGMQERGRSVALLHVDSNNATGATRLYESVGMTPVVVLDVWRCTRSVG